MTSRICSWMLFTSRSVWKATWNKIHLALQPLWSVRNLLSDIHQQQKHQPDNNEYYVAHYSVWVPALHASWVIYTVVYCCVESEPQGGRASTTLLLMAFFSLASCEPKNHCIEDKLRKAFGPSELPHKSDTLRSICNEKNIDSHFQTGSCLYFLFFV